MASTVSSSYSLPIPTSVLQSFCLRPRRHIAMSRTVVFLDKSFASRNFMSLMVSSWIMCRDFHAIVYRACLMTLFWHLLRDDSRPPLIGSLVTGPVLRHFCIVVSRSVTSLNRSVILIRGMKSFIAPWAPWLELWPWVRCMPRTLGWIRYYYIDEFAFCGFEKTSIEIIIYKNKYLYDSYVFKKCNIK